MEEIKSISKKQIKMKKKFLKLLKFTQVIVHLYEFIEDINNNYSKDDKLSLLGFMWKIMQMEF